MENSEKSLLDYIDILRRRKLHVIASFAVTLLLSMVVVFSLPPIYQSQGVILIEWQEVPHDLIRSTVTSYAEQQIELVKRRILSSHMIMEILEKYDAYGDASDPATVSIFIEKFRSNVLVEMVNATVIDPKRGRKQSVNIAFTVSFLDGSPQVARQVANELVTLFLDENVRVRTSKAAETVAFLGDEADKMQRSVQELEEKIASFKAEFGDSLPELLEFNLSMIESLEEKLQANQLESTKLTDQIHYMNMELSNIDPSMASAEDGITASPPVRLAQLNNELSILLNKYSASHPDVKRVKREISTLELQIGSGGSSALASGEIYNPLYRQMKMKIDAAEKQLQRTVKERSNVETDIADYQSRVARTHQVKRAYDDLTRDYENKRAKYQELRAKQLEADVAQNLESESKADSFTLIEPPREPVTPVKPNRPMLAIFGLMLSGGVGMGLALLLEMLDPSVRGINNISRIVGAEPLAVIPAMLTTDDIEKKYAARKKIIFSLIGMSMLLLVVVHFFVIKLDLLWFKVLAAINML